MRYLKFSIFILIFLSIGCGVVYKLDKSDEYKNASMHGKPIVLPSDLSIDVIEDHYSVPKAHDNLTDVSILPPRSSLTE